MNRCEKSMTLLRCLVSATLLLALARCGSLTELAGAGVETTNGRLVGSLVQENGQPVSNALVRLYPAEYDPEKMDGPIPFDTADESGDFEFDKIKTGSYNVLATQAGQGTKAATYKIQVSGDTVVLAAAVMRLPGSIKIEIPEGRDTTNGYFYIPGTDLTVSLKNSSGGWVIIDSVPAGTIPSISYSSKSSSVSAIIRYNVQIIPGDTTVILNPLWKYAQRLFLNTTTGGANVPGEVYNFPILVRLAAGNFIFAQAKADGSDIRFTKNDGTSLPCEIERWDPAAGLAEMWVKVDTVHGNDSVQSLIMYWGTSASSVTSISNSQAVFDTADGFQGVWHLSEPGTAIAKDATVNHYDGTPSDTAPAGTAGVIGPCRSFNGSSNYIRMNGTANSKLNFPENGVYTVSAWAYIDTLDNGFHLIVGKGNEQYFIKLKLTNPTIPNSSMVWEFVEYHDNVGYFITNSLPSAKAWTHLAGIRNGSVQYLYVNGELVDSTVGVSAFNVPRNTGEDVSIGKYLSMPADTTGGRCPFLGKIDEVRISNVACGSDWIKLCYMNQKEQDALVKW